MVAAAEYVPAAYIYWLITTSRHAEIRSNELCSISAVINRQECLESYSTSVYRRSLLVIGQAWILALISSVYVPS